MEIQSVDLINQEVPWQLFSYLGFSNLLSFSDANDVTSIMVAFDQGGEGLLVCSGYDKATGSGFWLTKMVMFGDFEDLNT